MPFNLPKVSSFRAAKRSRFNVATAASRQLGRCERRSGFTLIEVMIATAVTLLMMLGLAQMFKVLGDSINKGRAGLELNNRLRSVMHRIRTDLDNVTAMPRPPMPVGAGQGYFKIYDGPMSDFTLADNVLMNRFGDVDDIFMATVKAKDTWFTGKVPRFIVERRAPTSADELSDVVTIASEFAEVVIFAQPLVAAGTPPGFAQPGFRPVRDPSFLASHPDFYERAILDGVESNLPAGYRLHYRTLLIRPDLNLSNGQLPNAPGIMTAQPQTVNGVALPSPTCDMIGIHQFCDLSVRRLNPLASGSPVAANSLEDLANPANRFAHVIYPVPSQNAVTMPALALRSTIVDIQGPNPSLAGAGFLHPAFILSGDRTGEDILTTDLLAFDIRAFDSSAPVVNLNGITLRPGDPGFGSAALPVPGNTAAYGEFVDLNWAAKHNVEYRSELSGFVASGSPANTALFRSGLLLGRPPNFLIYQPAFDSFSDIYEQDGILQAELRGLRGVVTPTGNVALQEPWRASAIDAGRDGIDNAATLPGIDDASELETSPPFPVSLRGIQISVRIEDRAAKQFRQMSTVKEFVTN